MKLKHILLSMGIASLLLVTSFLILLSPSDSGNEDLIEWSPEWYVSIGDTFEYLVTIIDTTEPTAPYDLIQYSEFNGTRILVEIVSLPELPELVNSSILIKTILEPTKTNIRFANGSQVLTNFVSFLNRAFSLSFLPIRAWNEIESLLPRHHNSDSWDAYVTRYFAKTVNSYNIGCYSWQLDSGGEYGGNVTRSIGIPFMVYSHWVSHSDPFPQIFAVAHLV